MQYEERYTDQELATVVGQGLIYMCACPAQVAEAVRKVRELHRYQMRCLENPSNDGNVHQAIAKSAVHAHTVLQDCLDEVIRLEQWDRKTLQMPEGLRARQMRDMLSDD